MPHGVSKRGRARGRGRGGGVVSAIAGLRRQQPGRNARSAQVGAETQAPTKAPTPGRRKKPLPARANPRSAIARAQGRQQIANRQAVTKGGGGRQADAQRTQLSQAAVNQRQRQRRR